MQPPEQILYDSPLLAWAEVPASARFTGRLHLYAGDDRVGRVAHLAICRPPDQDGLLLVHCDASWEVIGVQAWNAPGVEPILTVDAMKAQAERYYEGLMAHWREVPGGTGSR